MGNLEEHAERELRRAGLFDKDSDYEGLIGESVMALIKVFRSQGHSGFSAQLTLKTFDLIAHWKTLTPITDDPGEWNEVSANFWQNKRQPSLFSHDGGKTYYDVDDRRTTHESAKSPLGTPEPK